MNTWKTADAPLEGDVRITPGVRTYEGGLEAEPRVRDDVGGWAR